MIVLFSSGITAASSGQVALPPPPLSSSSSKSIANNHENVGTSSPLPPSIPPKKQPSISLQSPPIGTVTPNNNPANEKRPVIAEFTAISQGGVGIAELTSSTNDSAVIGPPIATPPLPSLLENASTGGPPTGLAAEAASNDTVPTFDIFGIKKIYPTKLGGEEWFMDMENPTGDGRFDPKTEITRNADGSWKVKNDKVRMNVFTSTGYDNSKITTIDHAALDQKGYMQSPNDWKNVEITGYVKVNKIKSEDNFAWYARGGFHGDEEPCEGVAYKVDLFYEGDAQVAKEQWHVEYSKTEARPTGVPALEGKWTGFKAIIYNIQQPNGKIAVKTEAFVDKEGTGENWIKVFEETDGGGWGRAGTDCGKEPDQIVTWGGPVATFRWDNANDVDVKDLSIREISAGGAASSSANTQRYSNPQSNSDFDTNANANTNTFAWSCPSRIDALYITYYSYSYSYSFPKYSSYYSCVNNSTSFSVYYPSSNCSSSTLQCNLSKCYQTKSESKRKYRQ